MVVLIFTVNYGTIMASNAPPGEQETFMHTWTVAKVIDTENEGFQKVVFLESARFYKLMRNNKNFAAYLAILKDAEENKSKVKVRLTEPHGDIIEHVEK